MLGWLTPDSSLLTGQEDCRVIKVPPDLWSFVSGAIGELANVERWEQFGTATPDEMAEYFEPKYRDFLESMCFYIGELRFFALSTLPQKWLPMDGGTRTQAAYPELYAAIPAAWRSGTNFILPPQAGRSLVGIGNLSGFPFNIGIVGGARTITLSVNEMPAHTHTELQPALNPNLSGVEAPTVAATVNAGVTGSTGGGQAHNNMPPHLNLNMGIYAGRV